MLELDLLIDGQAVQSGNWCERENPAHTSHIVGRVAEADAGLAAQAVEAAHQAWPAWRAVTVEERCTRIVNALDAAIDELPDLPRVLARELGKVLQDCASELSFVRTWAAYVAKNTPGIVAGKKSETEGGRLLVLQEPFGVVTAITPWNAPLSLAFLKVIPALATGNSVVVKPSPLSPLAVTALLSALAQRLPAGVLNVVNGGADVGEVLASHELVRKVAFTGGLATARNILHSAAQTVKPTVLELGGNDAAVFLPDAEFSQSAMERIIFGTFLTSGQVCMAAKRLYVPRARVEEFLEQYRRVGDSVLTLGDPLDPHVTMGPMVTRESVDRVATMVADAVAGGAECVELGAVSASVVPANGYWMRPSLVVGARDEDRVVAEEQFGPTVPVLVYDDEDEVVQRANAGDLALCSSVWSSSEDEAIRVARRLDTGYTFINSHNRMGLSVAAPFGGWRHSGHGRAFGVEGITGYTQSHAIHAPRFDGSRGTGTSYPEA